MSGGSGSHARSHSDRDGAHIQQCHCNPEPGQEVWRSGRCQRSHPPTTGSTRIRRLSSGLPARQRHAAPAIALDDRPGHEAVGSHEDDGLGDILRRPQATNGKCAHRLSKDGLLPLAGHGIPVGSVDDSGRDGIDPPRLRRQDAGPISSSALPSCRARAARTSHSRCSAQRHSAERGSISDAPRSVSEYSTLGGTTA